MDDVWGIVASAVAGVVLGLVIAGVRSKLHRRDVRKRWAPILQQFVQQYGEAMDEVVLVKNSGNPTKILLAQTQWLMLGTQVFLMALFLEAEGVRDTEVALPTVPWETASAGQ